MAAAPAAMTPGDSETDRKFLAKMIGHHQEMLVIAEVTMAVGTGTAKADACKLYAKELAARNQLFDLLSTRYAAKMTPVVRADVTRMADSLKRLSGASHNTAFYQMTVRHHQEGIAMIEEFMSGLQDAEVRTMASKMKVDLTTEITEFGGKAAGTH